MPEKLMGFKIYQMQTCFDFYY